MFGCNFVWKVRLHTRQVKAFILLQISLSPLLITSSSPSTINSVIDRHRKQLNYPKFCFRQNRNNSRLKKHLPLSHMTAFNWSLLFVMFQFWFSFFFCFRGCMHYVSFHCCEAQLKHPIYFLDMTTRNPYKCLLLGHEVNKKTSSERWSHVYF